MSTTERMSLHPPVSDLELLAAANAKAIPRNPNRASTRDEGKPGPRSDSFYAGYFRDLDGNKLNAFFIG